MPESVTDRCTKAHEYVFLMSKSGRYHFDQEAIKEECSLNTIQRLQSGPKKGIGTPGYKNTLVRRDSSTDDWTIEDIKNGANKRSVWQVSTSPYSGAHFAVMPPALIEPCILAGCPKGGTVLDPFGGAGTVGLVADRLGRNAALIELNDRYCWLAKNRIMEDAPMFTRVEVDWLNDYAPDVAWPAA
jgi:DNA modification methylase